MALSQRYPVGSKAEEIDEDGFWCICTVEEVEEEEVIVLYDGWHAEWNCRISNPHEIRDQCAILWNPVGSQNYTLWPRQSRPGYRFFESGRFSPRAKPTEKKEISRQIMQFQKKIHTHVPATFMRQHLWIILNLTCVTTVLSEF